MRLDRNTEKGPRFRVLRRVENPQAMKSYDWQNGVAYEEVPATDCFVLKRQDFSSPAALAAYAKSVSYFDPELAEDVGALSRQWLASPGVKKQPD